MGARYYDPKLARFISPDPVVPLRTDLYNFKDIKDIPEWDFTNPQKLNRYTYCENNPVRFVDPTGLLAFFWHGAITFVSRDGGSGLVSCILVNTTTSFPIYNNRGQLKKKTDPLLKDTIFEYDNAGRLSYVIDRNNQRIDYSYTPTSKIDTITYPDASTVHFTYNQHDDSTGMQDSIGNTSYTYDAAHRLTSVTNPHGFVIGYSQYDENGNLTELTYPGNKKVIYTYDELNRLWKVKIDWLNQTATYNYDDAGRLDYVVNFNGTITDYGYDNANRLITLENKKTDTSVIASYSFTLDGNGNRTNVVQTEPLTVSLSSSTTAYGYNAKKNRLLTANTNNFGYDDEGQLATKDTTSYSFDYEHRLVTAGTNQYFYDGAGNRLKAVRNGVETRYIYDASGSLLAEADGNNVITKYYIYGAGLMAMVTPAGQVYTYHFNATGSTIAMTDSSQTIVNKYSYDAFGKVMSQDEQVPQPFKFVGQYGVMTEPNGFYYMRARYYDPEVGRFISEDPSGFDGGSPNLYAYVGNNPVNWVDPYGLIITAPVIITIGAAVIGLGVTVYALWSWYNSPEYQNALEKNEALGNKNLTDEEFLYLLEEYNNSLAPALEKGELTVELLYETKPWEHTIGPGVKRPAPAKECK